MAENANEITTLLDGNEISFELLEKLEEMAFSGRRSRNELLQIVKERQKPNEPGKRVKYGLGLYLVGREKEGLDLLREEKSKYGLFTYGRCCLENGDPQAAISALTKAVSKSGKDVESMLVLCEACIDDRRLHRARSLIEKLENIISAAPESEQAAATETEKPVSDNRNRSRLQYLKGHLEEYENCWEEAVCHYEESVKLDPANVKSRFKLAYYLDLRGEEEEAILQLEEAHRIYPSWTGILINLGLLYEGRKNYHKAISCYKTVLNNDPNNARARLFLLDAKASLEMYVDDEKEKKEDERQRTLNTPIADFELSIRSWNCLAQMGVKTIGELAQKTETDLLKHKNFGETSLREIKELLVSMNLTLGTKFDEKRKEEEIEEDLVGDNGEDTEEELTAKPLSKLNLSVRSRKCIDTLDIATIGEIVAKTEAELLSVANFGEVSLKEIKADLARHGLSLTKRPRKKTKNSKKY